MYLVQMRENKDQKISKFDSLITQCRSQKGTILWVWVDIWELIGINQPKDSQNISNEQPHTDTKKKVLVIAVLRFFWEILLVVGK